VGIPARRRRPACPSLPARKSPSKRTPIPRPPARLAGWREAGVNRLSPGRSVVSRRHPQAPWRLQRRRRRAPRPARGPQGRVYQPFARSDFRRASQGMDEWLWGYRKGESRSRRNIFPLYGLTIHEDTHPFAALERAGALAPARRGRQAGQYTPPRHRLIRAGYEHYEISNFALPRAPRRPPQKKTTGSAANGWRSCPLRRTPRSAACAGKIRAISPPGAPRWMRAALARSAPAALTTREEIRIESLFLGPAPRRGAGPRRAAPARPAFDLARERASATRTPRRPPAGSTPPAPGRPALTARGFLVADFDLRELA
jgi:hypothetical protein